MAAVAAVKSLETVCREHPHKAAQASHNIHKLLHSKQASQGDREASCRKGTLVWSARCDALHRHQAIFTSPELKAYADQIFISAGALVAGASLIMHVVKLL